MKITRKQLRCIIRESIEAEKEEPVFDWDGDGDVDYDEFASILQYLKRDYDKMKPAELSLLSMKIDDLISQLEMNEKADRSNETLQKIIQEQFNFNPSFNLYQLTVDTWRDWNPSEVFSNKIRDIYINLSSISQQFAMPETGGDIDQTSIDRNISEIKSTLDEIKEMSLSDRLTILSLTGDADSASAASVKDDTEDIQYKPGTGAGFR